MTAAALSPAVHRPGPIWRIVRLLAVKPAVFFGIPWLIMGGAWAVTMVVAVLLGAAGVPTDGSATGFRYSWAVLSPQWYLAVVGVQAVAYTFSFALGFSSTRRDFWAGMSAMFLFVSTEMAVAIATLVQVEKATHGWFIGAGMFDALWYGQNGWAFDFYTTFAMQLAVLFLGAGTTAVYMRWRMNGILVLAGSLVALLLIAGAILTWTSSWIAFGSWLAAIGIGGLFTIVLALAAVFGVAGYLVIRGATPR